MFHKNFSKTLRINKTSITVKNVITDKFNEFFINLGSNLASNFDSFFPQISKIFCENSITEEEFKNAFFFVEN